jgi:hypothetical protein
VANIVLAGWSDIEFSSELGELRDIPLAWFGPEERDWAVEDSRLFDPDGTELTRESVFL